MVAVTVKRVAGASVPPTIRVNISWRELTGEYPTEAGVVSLVKELNKLSALVTMARINVLLAVDRFRRDTEVTTAIQTFLGGSFIDDELLAKLKAKFGPERLDFRPLFHSQQVLLLARYIVIHSRDDGGVKSEESQAAREILGKSLLLVSDLLVSPKMAAQLRDNKMARSKRAIFLQLSSASGVEVNNPPNMRSSIVRSDALFGEILDKTPSDLNLAAIFRERTGMEIREYVDFNIGTLVNYLARDPKELIEKAEVFFLNPASFFPATCKGSAENFWKVELGTVERYRDELTAETNTLPHHNFTAFRKRPFFRTDELNCMPIHPCFVQEKLEAGLFWTIFHTLESFEEKDALFRLWGRLFETYITEALKSASLSETNQFIPFPKYRDDGQEAFDAILCSGSVCAVFEAKGGFLKAESKFSEDPELLMPDLQAKFGSSKTGALRQMASNITQVFARKVTERREIEGLDLKGTKTVLPVMVVQDRFVSSPFTSFLLAELFRSELRKLRLTRDIDCQCQGLIVVDAYDVEALRASRSNSNQFDLLTCMLDRSRYGDVMLDFHDFLIDFAGKHQISLKSDSEMDSKVEAIFNRISQRFFEQPISATDEKP